MSRIFGIPDKPMSNAQKVSAERLAELKRALSDNNPRVDYRTQEDCYTALTELQSLRAAPTPDAHSEVVVKVLEWRPLLLPVDTETAKTAFASYRFGEGEKSGDYYWLCAGEKRRSGYASETEAKAAAQSDFEQRVRSCLFTGSAGVKCPDCQGLGAVDASQFGEMWNEDPCPSCLTAGVVNANPVAITDKMVERACLEWDRQMFPKWLRGDKTDGRTEMRSALTAALASKPEGER